MRQQCKFTLFTDINRSSAKIKILYFECLNICKNIQNSYRVSTSGSWKMVKIGIHIGWCPLDKKPISGWKNWHDRSHQVFINISGIISWHNWGFEIGLVIPCRTWTTSISLKRKIQSMYNFKMFMLEPELNMRRCLWKIIPNYF